MREILFRGQNTFSFNWVIGYYHQDPEDGHFITEFEYVPVSGSADEPPSGYFKKNITQVTHESVGQFTGLTDKNGTKIFENDIVRILYTDWTSKSENDHRTLEEYLISISDVGKVVFNTDRWELEFVSSVYPEEVYTDSIRCGLHGRIEVIGNVQDNPELLK